MIVILGFLLAIYGCSQQIIRASPSQFNILLILADDLRADVLAHTDASTTFPNLSKLTKRSLNFNSAYAQISTCGPSRNSFLSGRRVDNVRSWNFIDHVRARNPSIVTLPQFLRKFRRYSTYSFGKVFHLYGSFKDDRVLSWTKVLQVPRMADKLCPDPSGEKGSFLGWCTCRTKVGCDDSKIVNDAVLLLKKLQKGKKQWMVAVGLTRPHLDYVLPPGYDPLLSHTRTDPARFTRGDLLPNVAFSQCEDWITKVPFKNLSTPILLPTSQYPSSLATEIRTNYWRSVAFLDTQVGQLLNAVNLDQTLVIFWSDHGYSLGERAHWCKNALMDVHTRVPLMISLPTNHWLQNNPYQGKVVNQPVELVDMFPTIVSLALKPRNTFDCLQGRDLSRYFTSTTAFDDWNPDGQLSTMAYALSQIPMCDEFPNNGGIRPCTFWSSTEFQVMGYSLKVDSWRYTEWRTWQGLQADWTNKGLRAAELYTHGAAHTTLEFDDFENNNVIKEHPDIAKQLAKLLNRVVNEQPYLPKCLPSK